MRVEMLQVIVPIRSVAMPHRVERVEDGHLDVGVDAVHQRDTSVREVEDDGVLVPDVFRSDDTGARSVQMEAAVIEDQAMDPDPPRQSRPCGGKVRVGHDDLGVAVAADHLDPRVFEHVVAVLTGGGEHVSERVVHAVGRREDQDVRHVVQETRSLAGVRVVAVANAAGEQVVRPLVDQEPGVEDRVVARDRPCLDHRPVGKSGDERREGLWLLHTSAGG